MAIAYVFLADGFEEMEAITPVDLMRRAGVNVFTVSIYDTPHVTGSHGIRLETDMTLHEIKAEDADLLVCPGGLPGSTNLADNKVVCELLRRQAQCGGLVAAICAAPAVTLAPLGILEGKDATCYPGLEEKLGGHGASHKSERVVRDGNIITANGPSSAFPFGIALVEALCGDSVAEKVEHDTLMR